MQIKNNIQESTVTTGTGDITLSGSSDDGNTFASGYVLMQRFPYVIDDGAGSRESGVGYLSASTTLVREVTLSSSNSDAAVNFAAGIKQVFVAATAEISCDSAQGMSLTGTLDYKVVKSAHLTRSSSGVAATTGTRVFFMPFVLDYSGKFDAFAAVVRTVGTAGSIFLGLYTRGAEGLPDKLLIDHAVALDPTLSGIQYGTFTEQKIELGRYFMAFTCDVNVTMSSASTNGYGTPQHLGVDGTSLSDVQGFYYVDAALSSLPTTVGSRSWTAYNSGISVTCVGLRATT